MFNQSYSIMIRIISLFIGMVLFPATMNAQQYEGETDKKGHPNGQGIITFNNSDGVEKLEGTFEKGMPVKGKSMRFDKEGRITMEFEGTFRPKEKGKFTCLTDLLAYGNSVFYFYEDTKSFENYGYRAGWGNYEGNTIKSGQQIATKESPKSDFSPEARKYYDFLFPQYVYYLTKDKTDKPYSGLTKSQGAFDVPSVIDQNMEHFTITDICGNITNDMPDGVVYGLACKDNDKYQLYYFKGDFESGKLKKINTLKQYVHGGRVRNLYVNSQAQSVTPFFSEEDFDEYLVIDGKHFSNKMRKVNAYRSEGSEGIGELESILRNSEKRNDKDVIERAKVICAYKLTNPRQQDWGIYKVLKMCPEIANAKNVIASWDGSKKVNIKDAFLEYIRSNPKNNLFLLYYVYNDWAPLTEDEIFDTEHNFILTRHPQQLKESYNVYFPNGQYVGKDFYEEAWAEAYINNYKRMLKKNDPKLWVDNRDSYTKYGISYFDWLHYPKLSKGIGGYTKNTRLSSLLGSLKKNEYLRFNKRKLSLLQSFFSTTEYVFKNYYDGDLDDFRSDAFNVIKEGKLTDEAKTYRSLLDAIGAASQIDDNFCKYTGKTDEEEDFQRWSACHIVLDYLIEGIKASRKLAASTPEIRPACKKAEEFIRNKIDMLDKKVFVNDEAWIEVINNYNQASKANKEANEKLLQEVENLGLPAYKYQDDKWQDDYGDELYREICFEGLLDISCTKIWKAKNGSYYKTVAGVFLNSKYKTERDAIIGAYAFLKYGEVRQKGRIK